MNPMITQRRGNHGNHASTSTAKPNIHGKKLMLCIWWDQFGDVYYKLLKPNEAIIGALYRTIDEIEPSTQEKTSPLLLQT